MNTKGMKFLAVLAVLAMAFAAFAVIAPADDSDAATAVSDKDTWDNTGKILTSKTGSVVTSNPTTLEAGKVYYISNDASYDLTAFSGNMAVLLLIEQGKSVTINVPSTVTGTGNNWYCALSVVKSTSGTDTVYTSPTAVGTLWVGASNKLAYDLEGVLGEYSYAQTGVRWGLMPTDVGVWSLHATADGIYKTSDSAGSAISYLYAASDDIQGTYLGPVSAIYAAAEQTINVKSFTGTLYTNKTSENNQVVTLKLTKFTGVITKATNGQATVAEWIAGDIEVVKSASATTTVTLKSDIPTGATLYVNSGQFVTTAVNDIHHEISGRTAGVLYNDGTVSIKQDNTGVGTFELKTTAGLTNNGVITNLGMFEQKANVTNNGKIVTLNDTVAAWDNNDNDNNKEVENYGTFTFKETTAVSDIKFSKDSTGTIRNQIADSRNKDISGGITNDTYETSQSATIVGPSTLTGTLVLKGLLVVEEGQTLTIADGGKIILAAPQAVIINNGTIEVQSTMGIDMSTGSTTFGGAIYNYGTMEFANAKASPNNVSAEIGSTTMMGFFQNFGTFDNQAGVFKLLANSSFINQPGATFIDSANINVEATALITNGGAMVFNGTVTIAADLAIKITNKNAAVQINELGIIGNAGHSIIFQNYVSDKVVTNVVELAANSEASYIILSGLNIATYGTSNYYFMISGSLTALTKTHAELATNVNYVIGLDGANYKFTPTGATKASYANKVYIGDLIVADHVRLSVVTDAVPGDSVLPAGEGQTNLYFIGDAYFDPSSAHIGTLAQPDNDLTVSQAFVTGEVITYKNPLSGPKVINAASFYTVNNYNRTYYYTTFENAIAGASDAGVFLVSVTGKNTVATDVTIPAGDANNKFKVQIMDQAVLTIDEGKTVIVSEGGVLANSGTIYVNGTLYAYDAKTGITTNTGPDKIVSDVKVLGVKDVEYTNLYKALVDADAGDVVVITKDGKVTLTRDTTIKQGVILDTNENALSTDEYTLTIDGTLVLYAVSTFDNWDNVTLNGYIISDDKRSYGTTGLAGCYYEDEISNVDYYYIAGVKNLGDIAASGITVIDVEGPVSVSALDFAGAEDSVTVTFKDDVDVTTITAGNAKIVFAAGDVVTATVADANANSVKMNGDVTADKLTITITDSAFTVAGGFDAVTVADDKFVFELAGEPAVKALTVHAAKIKGDVEAKGAFTVENTLVVDGELTVNGVNVKADNIAVSGSLIVIDSTTSNGKVKVDNALTIGSSTNYIAAVASVYGNVEADVVVLFDGNYVDDEIIENMKYTEIYIDGKLWVTIYSNGKVTLAEDGIKVPVTNAKVVAGDYDDLVVDAKGILTGELTPANDKVNLKVKYDIYNVTIYTDAGVKAVYIDGQVMTSPEAGKNGFTLLNLEAGTYKVTYTLINGYEGSAQLYTADGTILKDNSFVLSGTGSSDFNVTLQLLGTEKEVPAEPTPEEQQSEWTITTILLVILVILIAIMAVIVALRLNRS